MTFISLESDVLCIITKAIKVNDPFFGQSIDQITSAISNSGTIISIFCHDKKIDSLAHVLKIVVVALLKAGYRVNCIFLVEYSFIDVEQFGGFIEADAICQRHYIWWKF